MGAPQLWSGRPLIVSGRLAIDPACCCSVTCGGCVVPTTVTVQLPGGWTDDWDECDPCDTPCADCPDISSAERVLTMREDGTCVWEKIDTIASECFYGYPQRIWTTLYLYDDNNDLVTKALGAASHPFPWRLELWHWYGAYAANADGTGQWNQATWIKDDIDECSDLVGVVSLPFSNDDTTGPLVPCVVGITDPATVTF